MLFPNGKKLFSVASLSKTCLKFEFTSQIIFNKISLTDPDSPRGGAPPSDENITADIICQPYIYRDAYSTGLTQLSGLSLLANLPLTVALSDGNPSDAVVTNSNSVSDQYMRLTTIRRSRPPALTHTDSANRNSTEETQISVPEENSDSVIPISDDEEAAIDLTDLESLPPDYSNVTNNNESSIRIDASLNDEPPPSYNECVKAL